MSPFDFLIIISPIQKNVVFLRAVATRLQLLSRKTIALW